jgi:hypothetical protein
MPSNYRRSCHVKDSISTREKTKVAHFQLNLSKICSHASSVKLTRGPLRIVRVKRLKKKENPKKKEKENAIPEARVYNPCPQSS